MGKMGDGKHQEKLLCNQLMWNETGPESGHLGSSPGSPC